MNNRQASTISSTQENIIKGPGKKRHILCICFRIVGKRKQCVGVIASASCQHDAPGKRGISSFKSTCGYVCGDIFLITNWWGTTQLTLSDIIPEQVDLGCIGKIAKQARNKIFSGSLPQSLPPGSCLGFLQWWTKSQINPFSSSCFLSVLSHSNKEQIMTAGYEQTLTVHELRISGVHYVFLLVLPLFELSVFLNNFKEENNSNQQKER